MILKFTLKPKRGKASEKEYQKKLAPPQIKTYYKIIAITSYTAGENVKSCNHFTKQPGSFSKLNLELSYDSTALLGI